MPQRLDFDFDAFYRALSATVAARDTSWKAVSDQTGVSQSTLSRMSKGRQPDAASLMALSAWSGINPVDFSAAQKTTLKRLPWCPGCCVRTPTLMRTGQMRSRPS